MLRCGCTKQLTNKLINARWFVTSIRIFHLYVRQGGAVAQRVERWTCDQQVKSYSGQKLRNNLGQVVHTYVPLSPSSITWYRPKGGDALRLGR